MPYPPEVMTRLGPGRLFKIVGNKAWVEFDYMYLVELRLEDILGDIEALKQMEGVEVDEG